MNQLAQMNRRQADGMEGARISIEKLREEVHALEDQLGPNHLFGIIQFTRKWEAFKPELVQATERVRAEARLRVLCFYPQEESPAGLKAWVRENGDGTLRVY